ncbi:MAG: LysR family transcriptional regulator [Lachnospiraceae bacterium]
MTILQLKYVIGVANSSSVREAANRMFVSQPALSMSIQELEKELGIQIFNRTTKGIFLTEEGREFLSYAKQAVSQYELIEDKYLTDNKEKKFFSVSTQHYIFAIHAYINTVKKFENTLFNYSIHETRTDEVIDSVRRQKSEVGIISYTKDNESLMKKILRENHLTFFPLLVRNTFVYIWNEHPLADKKEISLNELEDYPCISFDQESDNEYYLAEEALARYDFKKIIKTNDRATTAELLIGLNGYSIGTGIMIDSLAFKDEFVCIKLKEEDPLTIGYIIKKEHELSEIAQTYIDELVKYKE